MKRQQADLHDRAEHHQSLQTRHRRQGRRRHRQLYAAVAALLIAASVLAAPSLVSHSSIGRQIVVGKLHAYGLEGQVQSLRVGWITPLQLNGLQINGATGTRIAIDQINSELTAADLLASALTELGQFTLRGIEIATVMHDGRCGLEADLQELLDGSDESPARTAVIKVQDLKVVIADQVDGRAWQLTQTTADVECSTAGIQASFAGVLTEPAGGGGSLQGRAEWWFAGQASPATPWRLQLHSESLPLSVVSLLRRRFPEAAPSIPAEVQGDATGEIRLAGAEQGTIEAIVNELSVRNFSAADPRLGTGPGERGEVAGRTPPGTPHWHNKLATLDGEIVLLGDRVIGRGLRATADFAAATVDGAFSRNFSLVGIHDNPLRWLEAIDGRATVEADLAALDQSLPGLLPLRPGAELVSGRVMAKVDSTLEHPRRRSQLTIHSDPIRARSDGRPVVIDPIQLAATVSSEGGSLRAEQFQWQSSFGSAVGQGDLRSGSADVEIDFGRLTSMLRPIIEVSESTLAGNVRGTIRWDATANQAWQLSGQGQAANLVIQMPSGQTLRRPMIQGTVAAVGRWGGEALAELTRADVTLATGGLDLQAELVQALQQPSAETLIPLRFVGQGRVDTLLELLGPWMPPELHDAAGRFRASGRAEISTTAARLTAADLEWTEAKLAYRDRYYDQSLVKAHFDGAYSWPAGELTARALTVAADAFSFAAQGSAALYGPPPPSGPASASPPPATYAAPVTGTPQVDLEIHWRAKLERLQGSVRTRLASREVPVRQVGYRSEPQPGAIDIGDDQWLVIGDCEGTIDLQTRDGVINIDTHASGSRLAIVQPPAASAASQTAGPQPRGAAGNQAGRWDRARIVWSEPKLNIDGWVRYDPHRGTITADELQVAGDWLATTLRGDYRWNDEQGEVQLQGPARFKMDQVASRLTGLLGTRIDATGIHQTPLEINLRRTAAGGVAIRVAADVGWEQSAVGGVTMGPAILPLRLTETTLEVLPARIPVGDGELSLAGQVHYRPGPLWMRLRPGSRASAIRLTPDMTQRWLKYLAPLVADAASIQGRIGVVLDEALIVVEQPQQSRLVGRLEIAGMEMQSGPLVAQVQSSIGQLQMLSQGLSSREDPRRGTQTLITVPAQTVEFVVDRGVAEHHRMFFQIDRAEVITSGRVGVDGRLDLVAQVPLDERWLGSDLKGLAGQPVALPIDGTLTRPSLDASGVRRVVAQLGAQAVQETTGNYLQEQLGKGLDKLLGR